MEKLKVLSLFSGIGSPEMALRDLGIEYELVGFSEIDKKAINSYCSIHGLNKNMNLGDITKINIENLPIDIDLDLITHGSPCQDFSVSGHKRGADEGSGTRSSLMWNTVEIVRHCKPKYILWENVKGVFQKSQIHNYEKYLNQMESLGYRNYSKLLNAKDFGLAQDRDRIFVVSIRNDVDVRFEFSNKKYKDIKLKDVLFDDVDDRFFCKKILSPRKTKKYIQYDNSGKGYNSQAARLYYLNGYMCTLPRSNGGDKTQVLLDEENMIGRRITPHEAWKLMGFSDNDFNKAEKSGQTMGSLYNQAGNSIALPILIEIFKNLLSSYLNTSGGNENE